MILSFDPALCNMACCRIDKVTKKISDWFIFSIRDTSNEEACNNLMIELDKIEINEDTDIVIEKQTVTNIATTRIANQVQMYYVIKKAVNPYIKKIVLYHAKNKEKYYKPRPDDEPIPEKVLKLKDSKYKRKKLVIEHCKRLLIHHGETEKSEFFKKLKKKDDMADAYVMSLSYLK